MKSPVKIPKDPDAPEGEEEGKEEEGGGPAAQEEEVEEFIPPVD